MKNKDKLKLNKDSKILLLIAALFAIAIGLSNTFVNIYIWRIKEDFVLIGKYNLYIHLFLPLTFIIAGLISKKKDGTKTLRLGIIFHALFFLIILILQEKAANYLFFLGSFLGIAAGFYWLSFQVLTFDLTNEMNRDTFNSYNGIVASLAGMFATYSAGIIIEKMTNLSGYYLIFSLSFLLFIIIIIISRYLKTYKINENLKLFYVIKNINQSLKGIMFAYFFYGIRNGVLIFLINLLIFIVLGSELSIGRLTMFAALLATISFEFIEKVMKPKKRTLFIIIGTMMMFIAILPLGINIGYFSILIFIILNSFFTPFLNVPLNSAFYNLIDKSKQNNERIELIIYKELVLNLARILGILAFILVANTYQKENLKLFLLIIGSTQLLIPFLIKKINQNNKVL